MTDAELTERKALRFGLAKAALTGLCAKQFGGSGNIWVGGMALGIDQAVWALADAVLNTMDEPSLVTKKEKP